MEPALGLKNITGLITTGSTLVIFLFINMILRRLDVSIFGFALPTTSVHFVLGPVLIFVNAAILYFLLVLWFSDIPASGKVVELIKGFNPLGVLGPLINPFFVGKYELINAIGYAFCIILWWLGMHSFWMSTQLNAPSPSILAWNVLVGGIYLVIGLASMAAIQSIFVRFGLDLYKTKWFCAFLGIGIGAIIPRLMIDYLWRAAG